MLSYLKESRKLVNISEKICMVIGNESCDLDSAVSALALAFVYTKIRPSLPTNPTAFLPLLNIPRKDFPLKTEVTYFLAKYDISHEFLTFKDDINDESIARNSIILVDHHVSLYRDSVIEVFDHRPFDSASKLPASCKTKIEQVGSCATLISDLVLRAIKYNDEFEIILRLLYGAIVMDTVNFSPEACRTTELDLKIAVEIENILQISDPIEHRKKLFSELVNAREDVRLLTAHQLLYKDMKLISNTDGRVKVGIPGFPISVQEFIRLPGAEEAVKEYADELNCSVVLLIGMKVTNGIVARDIGLVNIKNQDTGLFHDILHKIKVHKSPELELKEHIHPELWASLGGVFFQQQNIRATRKHILPIVKDVLEEED